jgi:hypothetical protein
MEDPPEIRRISSGKTVQKASEFAFAGYSTLSAATGSLRIRQSNLPGGKRSCANSAQALTRHTALNPFFSTERSLSSLLTRSALVK